jgi:phenylalanyl-tRNA synthetase beta chain
MRDKVFPSLVQNAVLNINRNEKDVLLFEVAKVFKGRGEKLSKEPLHLGILLTGMVSEGLSGERKVDFYDLKGVVESLFEFLKIKGEFEAVSNISYLHPGQSAKVVVKGEEVGFIGKLHPDILEKLDVKQDIFIGEFNIDRLLELSKEKRIAFKQIPKFPPVTRDIAVLVGIDTPVGELEKIIRGSAKYLEKMRLFDIYMGEGIPEGKKSVAFSLVFRSPEKTLSDEETNRILNGIIKELEKVGATLRA